MYTIFFNGQRYGIARHIPGIPDERDGWMILDGASTIEEAQSKIRKDQDFYRSQLDLC